MSMKTSGRETLTSSPDKKEEGRNPYLPQNLRRERDAQPYIQPIKKDSPHPKKIKNKSDDRLRSYHDVLEGVHRELMCFGIAGVLYW